MIGIKRPRQIEKMRRAGAVAGAVLRAVARRAKAGVRTIELDALAERLVRKQGGRPLFKGYRGYPNTLCVSINEEVVHGMPGDRGLEDGDIVGIDVGVKLAGWCGDAATTLAIGRVAPEAKRLMEVTRAALGKALEAAQAGSRLSRVSAAVQEHVESQGYSVVRNFTGHGIGREMHEEPQVPNFVASSMNDPVLAPGMTLAIEPMVNAGGPEVDVLENGWTVVTHDGSLSAHYEHTLAVTENGADILTL